MLWNVTIGIRTISYCSVTVDAADFDAATKMVGTMLDSYDFRGWVDDNDSIWDTEYEVVQADNIGLTEPTFDEGRVREFLEDARY